MNTTKETKSTTARGLLATLIIALALAFIMVPSLVLAANPDEEFTDPASDIAADAESPDDDTTEPDQLTEPDDDAPDSDPDPEPTSYSLRLIVSADDDTLRGGDAVLGSHDGVHLLGFPDEDALAEAEAYYADAADWSGRDISLTAADNEPAENAPAPVDEATNALTLLEESAGTSSSSPAGEAGTPEPELTPAAEGGRPLVALIDTGAPDDPAVVASAAFVGDDPADHHGHAAAMLEAMKSENPDIQIIAIKALGDDGEGSASSVYAAIEYATEQGADIINLSLAGYATDENAAIAEAVGRALENGITVIAAAGNGGYDAAYFTPANIKGVFAVGACDEDGNVLDTSNRGDCVSGYAVADSTSKAAARLSGWASASGDRDLTDCQFLLAPGDVSYDGSKAPDPSLEGRLSASESLGKSSGCLVIYPSSNMSYGGLDWNYYKGTHTSGSYANPERLYFYPNYHPGGIALMKSKSDNSAYQAYRVVSQYTGGGGLATSHHYHGIFTDRDGEGQQLVSSAGVLRADVANGTAVTGVEYAYFDIGYNMKVTLDAGSTNVSNRGTPSLYVIHDWSLVKTSVKTANGLYIDQNTTTPLRGGYDGYAVANSNIDDASNFIGAAAGERITIPTRSDGYTFAGYYSERNGGGWQYVDRYGERANQQFVTQSTMANRIKGDGWDTTLYALWEKDGSITLNSNGAGNAGTTGLYVQGNTRVLVGPSSSYGEFTTLARITVPRRTGYWFNGYYTGTNGTGALVIDGNGYKTDALTVSLKGKTLYAQWVPATQDTFTTTLNDNGGSGGPGAFYLTVYNNGLTGNCTSLLYKNFNANGKEISWTYTMGAGGAPTMGGHPSKKRFDGYYLTQGGVRFKVVGSDLQYATRRFTGTTATFDHYLYYMGAERLSNAERQARNPNVEDRVTMLKTKQEPVSSSDSFYSRLEEYTAKRTSSSRTTYSVPLRGSLGTVIWESNDKVHEWVFQVGFNALRSVPIGIFGSPDGYGWGSVSIASIAKATTQCDYQGYLESCTESLMVLGKIGDTVVVSGGVRIIPSVYELNATATVVASNRTAYAQWLGWALTLNAQGGALNGSATYYEVYGDGFYQDVAATKKVTSLPVPTRTGYTFKGWFQKPGGEGIRVASSTGAITSEPANAYASGNTAWCNESAAAKPVYALWDANTYTIALDPQGADEGAEGTTTLYELYDSGVYLSEEDAEAAKGGDASTAMTTTANPIEIPKKEGYVFRGYFHESTGVRYIDENGYITDAFKGNSFSANTTLIAKWTDPRAVLPLAGGTIENMPLMWGSAFAIVGASGFVLFRALRPNRADRRKAAHGARRSARKPARQPSRAAARSNAVARPSVRTRHAR